MEKIEGMIVKREKWEFWERLYKSWQDVLDAYIKNSAIRGSVRDLPYWHSERASISILAAAVWKIEETIAIEEYYTERVYSDSSKRTKGHCDLWVKSKDFSFSVEAKQLWPKTYRKGSIDKKIEEAEIQLDSLADADKKASVCLFSVCFISPRLDDKTEFDIFLNGIRKDFENKDSRIFYYDRRDLPDDIITWNKTGEKYPGVIMVVKALNSKK